MSSATVEAEPQLYEVWQTPEVNAHWASIQKHPYNILYTIYNPYCIQENLLKLHNRKYIYEVWKTPQVNDHWEAIQPHIGEPIKAAPKDCEIRSPLNLSPEHTVTLTPQQ